MIEQASFDFTARRAPGAGEVERLCAYLYQAGDAWLTSRQLAAALNLSDRRIRSLAEHSEGRIISAPGCPGYRHIRHCSAEMLTEVSARMQSQARAMYRRAIKIRQLAHALIH